MIDDDGGIIVTDICPACVAAGPQGVAERMQRLVAELREEATSLESLAVKVGGITEWATLTDMCREGLALDFAMGVSDEGQTEAEFITQHLQDWVDEYSKVAEARWR